MGKKSKHRRLLRRLKAQFSSKRGGEKGQHNDENLDLPHIEKQSTLSLWAPSEKVQIYKSELEYIARCIQDYPNIETGGQLFGAWTASGTPRVIYAIGPGPNANHQSTFFNQDIPYLETIGAKLKEFGLQHIGEWHSHHKLGLPHPSGHDAATMRNSIAQLNLHRFCLCIGSIGRDDRISINPFNFAETEQYVQASWEIISGTNRLRSIIDQELGDALNHPQVIVQKQKQEEKPQSSQQFANGNGWFSILENRQQFKMVLDRLNAQPEVIGVAPQICDNGCVQLQIQTREYIDVIKFPADFPKRPFEVQRKSHRFYRYVAPYPKRDIWEISPNETLFNIFFNNYSFL